VGSRALTVAVEKALAAVGLLRLLGSPVTVVAVRLRTLVTGATGFTGGHLARHLQNLGYGVRALVRGEDRRSAHSPPSHRTLPRRPDRPAALARALGGVDIVYNIGATYRQAAAARTSTTRSTRRPSCISSRPALQGRAPLVHCSTVGVHGDVERPPADEDAPLRRVTSTNGRSSKGASRPPGGGTDRNGPGHRETDGIYGRATAGCSSCSAAWRGAGRHARAGAIFYHLTYVEDLAEGFRLCGEVPAAAGRTYILAGAR